MGTNVLVLLLLALGGLHAATTAKDIVVIILSQENEHHLKLAENLKEDLVLQAKQLPGQPPLSVHLSHRDFPHIGGWTILPLIPGVLNLHGANSSWMIFVEDRTVVRLKKLLDVLNKYDENEELWIGHGLHDEEATIIHHFAFYDNPKWFKYPNLASGIALTTALIKSLSQRLSSGSPHSEFGIDSSHELSLFIWNKGAGQTLKHEPSLCIKEEPHCATFPSSFQQCGEIIDKKSIYFAVKTCTKYHAERIPVVKKTWARHATNIKFFSDSIDEDIPTIDLGIPNTDQGHCAKTIGIIRYINEELKEKREIDWIVIADDDTILGVSRLQKLLTCYNPSKPVALGERYGYNVQNPRGYNYITGGGGMVFSRILIEQLAENCECPMIDAPDDMYLGLCIDRLGISVTHSPLFHQARPTDYSPGYLNGEDAVSFHKHWMIDPILVYEQWFQDEDIKFETIYERDLHNEL